MSVRARLTLLFLGAVEVTFLSAVATYWGLQSWRMLADEVTLVYAQSRRLATVLEHRGVGDAIVKGAPAVADIERHVQTRDERRRVARFVEACARGEAETVARAARRLGRYYDRELQRLRARGDRLARVSTGIILAVVALVIATALVFLAAVRAWFVVPVRRLEQATEVMRSGDLDHRIVLPRDDELGRLASSINRMAASLANIQAQLLHNERFALLGELAAWVAHNIRNPLASIRATAQGESLDLPDDDPRREAFAEIVRAADRLDVWVADLLTSASPVALERRACSVSALVARGARLAEPRLVANGLRLDVQVPADVRAPVDEAKLEQVVGAMLANAGDASPPGATVRLQLDEEGDAAVIRVMDVGPGIDDNQRARLFTPFASNKASGFGLGLWLSRKIVDAHGGTIRLQAGVPTGTTVEIRIPLREDSPCLPS